VSKRYVNQKEDGTLTIWSPGYDA